MYLVFIVVLVLIAAVTVIASGIFIRSTASEESHEYDSTRHKRSSDGAEGVHSKIEGRPSETQPGSYSATPPETGREEDNTSSILERTRAEPNNIQSRYLPNSAQPQTAMQMLLGLSVVILLVILLMILTDTVFSKIPVLKGWHSVAIEGVLILFSVAILVWLQSELARKLHKTSGQRLDFKLRDIKHALRRPDILLEHVELRVDALIRHPNDDTWIQAREALNGIVSSNYSDIGDFIKKHSTAAQTLSMAINSGENLVKAGRDSDDYVAAHESMRRASSVINELKLRVQATTETNREYLLASANVFIEEAQEMLTRRAGWFVFSGLVCVIGLTVLLFWAVNGAHDALQSISVGHIAVNDAPVRNVGKINSVSTLQIVAYLLATLAYSGLIFVGIKGLLAVGRACLHEAAGLYDRRHALRFGRLYIYLFHNDLQFEQLESAFQWNKESRTAFQDIDVRRIADTPTNKLVDAAVNFLTKLAEERIDEFSHSKSRPNRPRVVSDKDKEEDRDAVR